MKRLMATAAAATIFLGTAAGAATLSIVGGTPGTIPDVGQDNNILTAWGMSPLSGGFFGSQIGYDGNEDIRIDFLGFEAGYNNSFTFDGSTLFDSDDYASDTVIAPLGTSLASVVIGGYSTLPFAFVSVQGGNAVNGSNPDNTPGGAANFYAYQDTDGSILLFFDDTGAGDDDNHDDFVVRISAVPLPAAAIPFLTALGGLGAFGLRRRRKAA